VEKLMKATGHPLRLSEVGVTEETLVMAPFHAIADTPTLFNARPVSDPNDIAALYKQVF
jgi:alcohol dehydrogenase class IV